MFDLLATKIANAIIPFEQALLSIRTVNGDTITIPIKKRVAYSLNIGDIISISDIELLNKKKLILPYYLAPNIESFDMDEFKALVKRGIINNGIFLMKVEAKQVYDNSLFLNCIEHENKTI
ncbi:hypothetical protein ACQ1Q5_00375 [Ornithobacterium rhinotracheale]